MTFDAVSLRVPSAWPVRNLSLDPGICPLLDTHAVYLGDPGPDPACPGAALGKTEAVQIEPADPQSPDLAEATTPTVIGGRAAWTNGDAAQAHTIVDVLPAAGVEVSLSYGGDPALIRQIESTITIGAAARAVSLTARAAGPAAAAQRLFQGAGFDACAAPAATAMSRWLASPYRAVGVYIGGVNRACAQVHLTAAWISAIQAMGWHYFPIYPGPQASCVTARGLATISPRHAAAEGVASAQDAATQARDLGVPGGTPVIYDMEHYGRCGSEVITFLNAWDRELHARGYRAGVYESFGNIGDLVRAAGTMSEPDVIHYAEWDGRATTRSAYMPARMWTGHQRIHQYQGAHNEKWGRVTMNIDNDQLDVRLASP